MKYSINQNKAVSKLEDLSKGNIKKVLTADEALEIDMLIGDLLYDLDILKNEVKSLREQLFSLGIEPYEIK
jgi:hypothetical protein